MDCYPRRIYYRIHRVLKTINVVVLFFLCSLAIMNFVEYLFMPIEEIGFESNREVVEFIVFPMLTILALGLVVRYEIKGGIFALCVFLVFLYLRPDLLLQSALWLYFIPAFLIFLFELLSSRYFIPRRTF